MSDAEETGGLSAVHQAMAEARPVVVQPSSAEASEGRAEDPPPHDGPVVPLGINGEYCFYLDASSRLRAVKHKDHSRLDVQALFGSRIDLLYRIWPRKDKDGNVVGWRPEKVVERLMAAATHRGVWEVMWRTRGRGAWRRGTLTALASASLDQQQG